MSQQSLITSLLLPPPPPPRPTPTGAETDPGLNLFLQREKICRSIEGIFLSIVESISKEQTPQLLQYRRIKNLKDLKKVQSSGKFTSINSNKNSSGDNGDDDVDIDGEEYGHLMSKIKFNKNSQRKFTLQLHLMQKIHSMLQRGQSCTIRDLYYEDVALYQKQDRLDEAIVDLCHILKVPREALNVEATSKGLIAGSLSFRSSTGERIDLSNFKSGMLIPSFIHDLKDLQTKARYILVVEKDAIFQRLISEKIFLELGPIIVITGKGYPDIATRQLVQKLSAIFQLQVFALVDCDPHGIEIAAIYRWGSYSQWSMANCTNDISVTKNMTVTNLIWLGLLPSEIAQLSFTYTASAVMNARDKRKIQCVKERIVNQGDEIWIQELEILEKQDVKAELEALFMNPKFAIFYINQKLKAFFTNKQPN